MDLKRRHVLLGTLGAAAGAAVGLPGRASAQAAAPAEIRTAAGDAAIAHRVEELVWVPELPSTPGQDDADWDPAASLSAFHTFYDLAPVTDSPRYQLGWRGDHLFVRGTVPSGDREAVSTIAVIVNTEPGGTEFSVVNVSLGPTRLTASRMWGYDWRPNKSWTQLPGISVEPQTGETASGDLLVRFAVPLSELGITGAPQGEWRFNVVHVTEFGAARPTSWVPIRHARYIDGTRTEMGAPMHFEATLAGRDAWGTLQFDGAATQVWHPPVHELTWTGYQSKHLSFLLPTRRFRGSLIAGMTADVVWIDPDGTATQVASSLSVAGSRFTVDFDHPPLLLQGRYQVQVKFSDGTDTARVVISTDHAELVAAGIAVVGARFPVARSTSVTPEKPSTEVQALLDLVPPHNGVPDLAHPDEADKAPTVGNWELAPDLRHIVYKPLKAERPDEVFPNSSFPEDQVASARSAAGELVEYPYHQDSAGRRYYFTPALWYHQLLHIRSQIGDLADRDPLGAARVLTRLAQVASTGFVQRTVREWNIYPTDVAAGPPFNHYGGFWSRWVVQELGAMEAFVLAYGDITQTDAFEVLSDELGVDTDELIRSQLVRPALDFVRSDRRTMLNVDPLIWRRLITFGQALREPDLVHLALGWMDDFMTSQFMFDGFWKEVAVSYHHQVMADIIRTTNLVTGYTDPPGYLSPRSGQRYDNLSIGDRYPRVSEQSQFVRVLTYPDSHQVPVQDTWANVRRDSDPRAGEPLVYPAAGLVRLSQGSGAEQTQLYVMATAKYGHNHRDALNITLFAHGQELLPDLGYTHTKYRQFACSTIGHNTVIVDGAETTTSGAARDGGRIERMALTDQFQVSRVSYPAAYPVTSVYQREPWLIPFTGSDGTGSDDAVGGSYLVDIFRITGGERHEYTLHGDANRDACIETQIATTPYGDYLLPPGTEVTPPTHETDFGEADGHYPGYQYVRDVSRAELSGTDKYDLAFATFGDDEAPMAKLHVTGLLDDSADATSDELFLGRSPSLRMTRLHGSNKAYDNNTEADLYDMPKFVHRREGTDLRSTFVTVLEPYQTDQPGIEISERLAVDSGPDDAVIVAVTYGGTVDIVVSNPGAQTPVIRGDLRLDGEFGLIRLIDGAVTELTLVAGSQLAYGDYAVTGAGTWTATVQDTRSAGTGSVGTDEANALVVPAPITFDPAGHYATVTHPDQSVSTLRVESATDEGEEIALDLGTMEPGFRFTADGGSEQPYYPAHRWAEGEHEVSIANRATDSFTDPAPSLPTGSITGTATDTEGQVLEGISINLTGYAGITATTGADGTFTLSGVPIGDRRVTAERTGYARGVSDQVSVAAGGSVTVTVVLRDLELSPELTEVTPRYAVPGDPVQAASSLPGEIFLVPDGTERDPIQIRAAVDAGDGVSTPAPEAGELVNLDTTGLGDGRFAAYAITQDRVSPPSPVALLQTGSVSLEDDHEAIEYTGTWGMFRTDKHSGGAAHYTTQRNAAVTVPFYGTRAVIKAFTNRAGGLADVYVDDQLVGELDYYSPELVTQTPMFDTGPLDQGLHLVRIVARGEKSPGTPATAPHVRLDVAETTA